VVLPQDVQRYRVAALVAATLACIAVLATIRIIGAPWPIEVLFQLSLVASFVALTIVDFRTSVSIVLFELVLAGAGGHWTLFPGEVTGRAFLEGTVTLAATATLIKEWRRTGRLELGRYGVHAVAVALALPVLWGAMGLARGNQPSNVLTDANGYLFFAFVLPIVLLIREGHGPWLRRIFFTACAMAAVVTAGIVFATLVGPASIDDDGLRGILIDDLQVGWIIGHMPNGAYRLYLGTSLYLVVGLALIAWRLLLDPLRVSLWFLWALSWIGVVASYTRGLWVAAALATILVLVFAARSFARPLAIAAVTIVLFGFAGVAGSLAGFSLYGYLVNRTVTIVSTSVDADADADVDEDAAGRESNALKIDQARILLRHIEDRPLIGHGFGTVVSEYPNGNNPSYDLSYLNLLLKAGILGLALYLSFTLRLLVDAVRARLGRFPLPPAVPAREAAVIVAIVSAVLLAGATNPYVLAAFGLGPFVLAMAWLERGSQQGEADPVSAS
jgi:hypothetical protein